MQHVEAKPDRRGRDRGKPPLRSKSQFKIGGRKNGPARNRHTGLAEAADKQFNERGINQTADAETRDHAANQGEA